MRDIQPSIRLKISKSDGVTHAMLRALMTYVDGEELREIGGINNVCEQEQ